MNLHTSLSLNAILILFPVIVTQSAKNLLEGGGGPLMSGFPVPSSISFAF